MQYILKFQGCKNDDSRPVCKSNFGFKMGNDTAWDLERVIIIFFIWIRSGNQERLLLEEKKIDLEESEDVIFFAESKIKLTKTQQRAHLERKDYQKVLSTITACDDTSIWWIIGLDIDCLRAYSFFNISQWWAKNQKKCTTLKQLFIVCLNGWNHHFFA